MGLRMTLVTAGGTLKDQGVLAEFIAELEDLKFWRHPRLLTDYRTSVHPVLVRAQHCMGLAEGVSWTLHRPDIGRGRITKANRWSRYAT